MDDIRRLAVLSVRRGCGFAALAICTVMFALIHEPVLSFRSGAILCALAAAVLYFKSRRAPHRNHRDTELWLLLGRDSQPPDAYAGRIINSVLAETYWRHACYAVYVASGLWLLAVVVSAAA
jgi:hypothetical protein